VCGKYVVNPALAAIVVFPDTYSTVSHIVSCLKMQTIVNQIEIVFVGPSNNRATISESELKCFNSWQLVEVDKVISLGAAYVEGINHAHAPIVALVHDHSFFYEKWAELHVITHEKSWAAVGPCICNGNPDTIISWADFSICYGEWSFPIASKPVHSLPAHHSSFKRDILLACGSQLNTLMEDEYFLYRHLAAQGYEFFLEAEIQNVHVNLTSLSSWIPSRFYKGRQFITTWTHTWSLTRRLLCSFASPILPLIRLWRIQGRILRNQSCIFYIRLLPILSLGLMAEWFGQILGFIAGMGDTYEKLGKFEFHRLKDTGVIHGKEPMN
jgi:hypothetical protein